MVLRPLKHAHQEVDHQLAITKDPDGTPKGRLFSNKLSRTLQVVPKYKALGFIIGVPGAIVLFSPDNPHTINV